MPDTIAADILWLPRNATVKPADFSPVLIKKGRSIYVDGTAVAPFVFIGDREKLSTELIEHFADNHWTERERQFKSRRATSFGVGWQRRCGCIMLSDLQGTRERFHRWHGEWENLRGDLVTYDLYAEGSQVSGNAVFLPRSVVDRMWRQMHP